MLRAACRLRSPCIPRSHGFASSIHHRLQRTHAGSVGKDVVAELEASPILQAVRRRVEERDRLQAQAANVLSPAESKARSKQLATLEPLHGSWQDWLRTRQLLSETLSLLDDPDPSMRALAAEEHALLLSKLTNLFESTFPSLLVPPSQTQEMSAIIELKAGVGGSEASLFLAELMRMYLRIAQIQGWKTSMMACNETENGGVKDAIVEIKGGMAYDMLRWESGVHRVQRVPATETSGRVHTSTVAVIVLPLSEDNTSDIDDSLFTMDEIKIEVMRSRGAGGQHVNKTESAVRLTHTPTGITVSMQDERSQHQNKRRAFQVLRARLMDRKLCQEVVDRRTVRRNLIKSADRSEKIRTYNFAQGRVTDHRLGLSLTSLTAILEGEGLFVILDALAKKHREDLLDEAFQAPA